MIEVGGQTLSGHLGVHQQLLVDPAAATILTTMRKSQSNYRFSNEAELNFRLKMGAKIVAAAHALNHSGASFTTFYGTRCNHAFWSLTSAGGIMLKGNASPSVALEDIFRNGSMYAFECATGMVIVLYKAVLDSIGSSQFNHYFTNLYLWDWEFDGNLGLEWERPADYFPGDVRYFKNPDVNPLHIEWQGENVIDVGNGMYYGHGIGILPAGTIIAELNKRRRPGAQRSAYLMEDAARPSFQYLAGLSGYQREARQEYKVQDHFITVAFGNTTHIF